MPLKFLRQTLTSWLDVYSIKSMVSVCNSIHSIKEAISLGARPIGSLHSYNKWALHKKAFKLGEEFNFMEWSKDGNSIYCGGSVIVEDLIAFALTKNKKMINMGNYRKQTVVSTCLSTHGFGDDAMVGESVTKAVGIDKDSRLMICDDINYIHDLVCILGVTIKVTPVERLDFTSCVCNLDDVKFKGRMALSLLPYSDSVNPVCLISKFEKSKSVESIKPIKTSKIRYPILKAWRLKLWWKLDCLVPSLRRYIQRSINFLKIPDIKITTHPMDTDYLYHPWPSLDSLSNSRFFLWAYKPTLSCFNIAFFIDEKDFKDCIKFIISESNKIDKTLLRCFIGCRYMANPSRLRWAPNYAYNKVAIDLYCSPKKHKKLIQLQNRVAQWFEIKHHIAKSVL